MNSRSPFSLFENPLDFFDSHFDPMPSSMLSNWPERTSLSPRSNISPRSHISPRTHISAREPLRSKVHLTGRSPRNISSTMNSPPTQLQSNFDPWEHDRRRFDDGFFDRRSLSNLPTYEHNDHIRNPHSMDADSIKEKAYTEALEELENKRDVLNDQISSKVDSYNNMMEKLDELEGRRNPRMNQVSVRDDGYDKSMQELEKSFNISLNMRDYAPQDINIKIDGHILRIYARHEVKTNGLSQFNDFSKSVQLPPHLDSSKLVSELGEDGVMHLYIKEPPTYDHFPTENSCTINNQNESAGNVCISSVEASNQTNFDNQYKSYSDPAKEVESADDTANQIVKNSSTNLELEEPSLR